MIHELKTYPKYFEETLKGNKSFECRLDDSFIGLKKGYVILSLDIKAGEEK